MIPQPAKYLLRFDELCPTMSRSNWQRFQELIEEFRLCPILAVIPDNRDSAFTLESPDPEFWDRMRAMEATGAVVALHGYQHLCDSDRPGLIPLHKRTEFAGINESTQQEWIHRGLTILRSHGLNPRLWVAPRHGFDQGTLRALHREGIDYLSDGFARIPFARGGIIWIPQQLWVPTSKTRGLWTICIHSNVAGDRQAKRLRKFLQEHAGQFTSFDQLVRDSNPGPLGLAERAYAAFSLWATLAERERKRRWRRH